MNIIIQATNQHSKRRKWTTTFDLIRNIIRVKLHCLKDNLFMFKTCFCLFKWISNDYPCWI